MCAQVAEHQHQRGRCFLLEHPVTASSWQLERIQRLASLEGVRYGDMDQCAGSRSRRAPFRRSRLDSCPTVWICLSPAHASALVTMSICLWREGPGREHRSSAP
eukprot:793237-Pyramimonas_sp.AAC.1